VPVNPNDQPKDDLTFITSEDELIPEDDLAFTTSEDELITPIDQGADADDHSDNLEDDDDNEDDDDRAGVL
jgi:hypothetical protein